MNCPTFRIAALSIAGMVAACSDTGEQPTVETPAPEAPSVAVQLPPGDPRNEVIQSIRYPNHGETKKLGMAKFGGAMVNVTQFGPILEGGEGHFMVDTGRTKVAAVYVWIGEEEDGRKRKWPADPEPDGYHVHCSVPRPLEEEHALWVEIRLPDGQRYHGDYYIGG